MDKNFTIESTRLLAVEGKDECNFFQALLKHMNIADVQIVDIGGKDRFPNEFTLLKNLDGFEKISVLGFVRDAERNAAISALDSVSRVFRQHGVPTPSRPGEVTTAGMPRVGVFIMPDNVEKGMLEHLCLRTVEKTPAYACVDAYVACVSQFLNEDERQGFNEPKTKVQAYLSSRIPIVNSLGLAALKGFWPLDHESLKEIRAFLRNMHEG